MGSLNGVSDLSRHTMSCSEMSRPNSVRYSIHYQTGYKLNIIIIYKKGIYKTPYPFIKSSVVSLCAWNHGIFLACTTSIPFPNHSKAWVHTIHTYSLKKGEYSCHCHYACDLVTNSKHVSTLHPTGRSRKIKR